MKVKSIMLGSHFLTDILTNGKVFDFKVIKGLPEGCKFHYCYQAGSHGIYAVFEHELFEDVKDGALIPELPPVEFWANNII